MLPVSERCRAKTRTQSSKPKIKGKIEIIAICINGMLKREEKRGQDEIE